MKKIFLPFICVIMLVCIVDFDNDPYAGKYKTANNIILELNSNGDCKIIDNLYKEVFYTYGKYDIKDNEIEIHINDDKENYIGVKSLKGKVKGSNIEFDDYLEKGNKIVYSKM